MTCERGVSAAGNGGATVHRARPRSARATTQSALSPAAITRPPRGRPLSHGLSARARRSARAVAHRGAALPRRRVVGGRRVPGRRVVLRPLRVLDHLASHRGVAHVLSHPAARLLGPSRATTSSGALRTRRGGRRLLHARRPAARDSRAQGQRDGNAALRRELAPDRHRQRLLHRHRPDVAAPAHLVPGDRGAVLPAVAPHPGVDLLVGRPTGCRCARFAQGRADADDQRGSRIGA